jgi:hypothetical protein
MPEKTELSRKTARWLFAASGIGGTVTTPALVVWYMGKGLVQPPYEGFVAVYGVLLASSLASLLGIWRPTRWLATVVATVLLGLGTLTAPSNGGMFVVLAFPVGLVGLFGLVEDKAGRMTPRATARHHNEEP